MEDLEQGNKEEKVGISGTQFNHFALARTTGHPQQESQGAGGGH